MSWVWRQSTGTLSRGGKIVAHGYAGHGAGVNNPAMQDVKGTGPLPVGRYRLTGVKSGGPTGPYTIVLEPEPGTDTRGRGDFRIHGDNARGDRSASHGCIVVSHGVRTAIWTSGDHDLEVVA